MRVFLSISSVLIGLLGVGWLFLPEAMLESWSAKTDPIGVYVGRRYAAVLLGYAAALWLCRAAGSSAAPVAILGGGALATGLLTLLALWGVLTDTIGPGGWGAVVVEAALAGGFLYYFLAERTQAQGKASS